MLITPNSDAPAPTDEHLFKAQPAPERALVDFKNIDPGAPSPVRVKFSTGFYAAVKTRRLGKPQLAGLEKSARSAPFQAGYDLGWQSQPGLETQVAQTAKMDECFRAWLGLRHGADISINDEATALLHTRNGHVDATREQRTGGSE